MSFNKNLSCAWLCLPGSSRAQRGLKEGNQWGQFTRQQHHDTIYDVATVAAVFYASLIIEREIAIANMRLGT